MKNTLSIIQKLKEGHMLLEREEFGIILTNHN